MWRNQKGVSLLETLLVLTVILVLLFITILPVNNFAEDTEKEQFMKQLQADLYMAQSYAFAKQEKVNLRIFTENRVYHVKSLTDNGKVLVKRKFPDSMEHVLGSFWDIIFLPTGNTSGFGTITFRYKGGYTNLIILIGKGRFYVKE